MALISGMATRWLRRIVLLICFVSLSLFFYGEYQERSGSLVGSYKGETLGMKYGSLKAAGWIEVTDVRADGPADKAGIQPGDAVNFDALLGDVMFWQPGETASLSVERDGERFRVNLAAQAPAPKMRESRPQAAALDLAAAILNPVTYALIAVLLIIGVRNRAALLLGCSFFALLAPDIDSVPRWATNALLFLGWVPLTIIGFYAWPLFALEISGATSRPRYVRRILAIATVLTVPAVVLEILGIFDVPLPGIGISYRLLLLMAVIALTLAVFGANYRRSEPAVRNRMTIFFAAFGCLFIGLLAALLMSSAGLRFLAFWIVIPTFMLFLGLLVYAVVSKRVFDFSFVINRTLVYGGAAFTLLVVFGLVEYIAKSMIPVAWPTAGPFFSAGIAVLLFLAFHRLHHWFDHHIEKLFFGAWHRAEAALRGFVESAAHFDSVDGLCHAFVDAVRAYSGGASSALYLPDRDGAFRLAAGEMAGALPEFRDDDPAFALLRARRGPVDIAQAASSLPGILALPMLDRGTLDGFVVMGPKEGMIAYRPDEVENLGWAVQEVGSELRTLRSWMREREYAELRDEVAHLTRERDTLKEILMAQKPAQA